MIVTLQILATIIIALDAIGWLYEVNNKLKNTDSPMPVVVGLFIGLALRSLAFYFIWV